jgi:hypothetical protein
MIGLRRRPITIRHDPMVRTEARASGGLDEYYQARQVTLLSSNCLKFRYVPQFRETSAGYSAVDRASGRVSCSPAARWLRFGLRCALRASLRLQEPSPGVTPPEPIPIASAARNLNHAADDYFSMD